MYLNLKSQSSESCFQLADVFSGMYDAVKFCQDDGGNVITSKIQVRGLIRVLHTYRLLTIM